MEVGGCLPETGERIRDEIESAVGINVLAVMTCTCRPMAFAQEPGEKTFASPQDAGKALYEAVKADDKPAMLAVLGQSASGVITSGDPVQDKNNGDIFVKRFEQMNRWEKEVAATRFSTSAPTTGPFPFR